MRLNHFKSVLILIIFLSPIFSLAVQAQTENKLVTITDPNHPGDAAQYSGTYVYQGTRSSVGDGPVKVRPYYKNGSYYLFADYYDGRSDYNAGFAWLITTDNILTVNPSYKWYGWVDGDMNYPEECTWWGDFGGNTVTIVIENAASGVPPTVSTLEASLVTTTSGTMGGNVTADGGAITDRGFVYSSTDATPTIGEPGVTQKTKGTGTGTYTEVISGLTAGVTYYYQAYGHNEHGTTYGGVESFTTPTTSSPNKLVSDAGGANGVYVWIGLYYEKPAWKHQSLDYWLYYSRYGITSIGQYFWYIDNQLRDEHGAEDFLYDHLDAATCPSSGWRYPDNSAAPVAISDYPQIDFTDGSAYSPGNPTGGTTNNPIGRFFLDADIAGASLTAATITVSGTRTNVTNLKLWSSTDATFNSGSDTQLNSQSDGASVAFSGFSSAISASGTYYFITADLASSASGTIVLTIGSKTNLTYSGGASSTVFTDAALTGGEISIIPAIEMNVKGNNTSITDGDATPDLTDHTDFGNVDIASGSVVRTFTIENTAAGTLTLTDPSPYVVLSGATTEFSLTSNPSGSISGIGSTTFQVTFNPTSTGLKSATISIANNDGNENPYNFNIQGTGIATPEMDISGLGVSIAVGDAIPSISDDTDFGSLLAASGSAEHTFTITNTGSAALTLTAASPYVTITGHSGDFTLSQTPSNSIAAGGGTTTFKITFDPTIIGTRSATISIANDDASENPYNFSVTGTGLAPEINVQGDGNTITDGDVSPSTTDDTDFGDQNVTSGTVSKTYTIQNTGTSTLTLGANAVSFSGGQLGDFSVTTQPATTVAAGGSTTFTIQFDPSAGGTRSTTVNIANDDTDENPYNFSIQGSGIYIAPTTQASTMTFSSVEAAKMTIGWTNGNGSARAVFVYTGSTGSASPAANTTYTADTKFGTGAQIGATGWYCVYNGVGTSVNVTGLMPGYTYRAMVCEYNGTAGYEAYNTSTTSGNPANQTMDGIMINEVDADSPGADAAEFVELYDGGIGNVSLDGLVIVFFDGSSDQSYNVIDLDTYSTDANGYFVLGNAGVTGVDATFANDLLQNGADAITLYSADAASFPNGTAVTTTNLVDALVYDNGQGDDAGLLTLLSSGGQINEAGRGNSSIHSNQRIPNGSGGLRSTSTYDQQPPTPDAQNYAYPAIISAEYNYSTNVLAVTCEYLVANAGADNDVDVSLLTITGEGGATYTLSSSSDVEITSATLFIITLTGADIINIEALLNKNGIQANDGNTIYNLDAADNWLPGAPSEKNIADAVNGITVSNFVNPVITSCTYDYSTGQLTATGTNFVLNSGSNNDVDASLLTFTGEGGGTYQLLNTSDVDVTSATQFSLTLSTTDKTNVNALLNKNGTSANSSTIYNLGAADNWMIGSPSGNDITDVTTGITVSNVPPPTITSATYDYNSNLLTVTGIGFVPKAGVTNDIDISKLIFTGEGGASYTLSSASDVEITSNTQFSVTITGNDLINVEALLNKNGIQAADGNTNYNLGAAEDWLAGYDEVSVIADLNGNGITVSNYANPTITSATYDAGTGVLVVTGTNLVSKSGPLNDIKTSLFTITGGVSESTYTLTNSADVELTSTTQFTLTLSATDQLNVNGLLNKNGTSSADEQLYNLAAADNWAQGAPSANDIADLTGNGITVSNVQTPTITSATYDSDSGVFVVTGTNMFKKSGAANDIDVSKFTITGEGGNYPISDAIADVEITSSTEFTFTVTGSDKTQVDAKLDLFGSQSSGGTTYNIAGAEDWLAGADPAANIADLAGNGITVSVTPKITSAAYNAATGVIVVTGTNIQANAGDADIDAQKFTITGEGGETYTLTITSDVERTSPTQFTLTLHVTDWNAIAQIINKNGTTSTSATIYNIAAADDWCTNVTAGNTADLTGNGITASNVAVPTISSATYNVSTGVLAVTGSRLVKKSGALNDIDISKLTITGEGGETYNISNTANVEITSGTQFTVTVDAVDKNAVNMILNKNGASSTSGTTYNLAAAEDWAVGADAAVHVVDAAGNGITVSNVAVPTITSASYHWSNGILTATGTGFTKKAGAANDIDASKLIFRGEGGALYTLFGSPDVEITSGTEFTITLDATDKAAVNLLLNKPGTMSIDNTVYNLAALEDWATGADAAVVVVDATTPITAGNFNNPPTGGNDVVNMSEDSPHAFAVTDFTYNDADADPFNGIQIQTLETAGELKYNGADVTIGLNCPDVTKLVFTSALNVNASPYAAFTFKVKDDRGGYSIATYTMTINVLPANDAPVLSNIESTSLNYTEGGSAGISNSITIEDDDDVNMESASVQISGNYKSNEDVLSFSAPTGISGTWSVELGTVTFTGSSSIADYQSALSSVSYSNNSENPDTSDRTVSFTVNDGELSSNSVSRNITINSVNNAPVISQVSDQSMLEDSSLTINLSATDAENNPVTFSALSDKNDVQLSITESKLTVSSSLNWNGSANIIVIASDGRASDSTNFNLTVTPVNDAPVINPIADVKINEGEIKEIIIEGSDVENDSLIYSALSLDVNVATTVTGNKLTIVPADDWVGNAEIIVTANDGKLGTSIRIMVEVLQINDAPVLSNIETEPLEYLIKGEGLGITSSLEITDIDNINLHGAVLSISGNYIKGEDRLVFSEHDGITGRWNSENGTITLTGKAALAYYHSAITNVQYINSFITPTASTRTISITVSDSQSVSNTVSRDINVTGQNTAPVLSSIEIDKIKFAKGESETLITSSMTVIDSDSKFLFEGSVTFSEGYKVEEDVLVFSNTSNITGSFDESSGSLVLNGQATAAEYQNVLRSVKYKNKKGVTAATSLKKITFAVRDGQLLSNQLSREIDVVSPLLAPSALTLQMTVDCCVKLTWQDNSDNEDGFIITRLDGTNEQQTTILDSINANTSEYVDAGVMECCLYKYVVLAYNNTGAVSDTTNDNQNSILVPLKAPTNLSVTVDPIGKINLTWNDDSSVEDNYFIDRSVITNDNFTMISQVDKDSTHYSDVEIIHNTKYFYRICAVKDTMKSLFSNEVEVIAIITDVNDELSGIPTEYKLYTNYPNPFNPSTVIKFDIPKDGKYILRVFNILGEVVSVLADKEFTAGRYNVTFDASNLSSGIYFYQLQGNEKNFVKKMLMVK